MKISKLNYVLPITLVMGISNAFALPNPAAVYCENQGGTPKVIELSDKGQDGICTFKKAAISEWTLYRSNHSENKPLAVSLYCSSEHKGISMIANPQVAYCESVGGTILPAKSLPTGNPVQLCSFKNDNSSIEAWTLYFGYHYPANSTLTEVLNCQ